MRLEFIGIVFRANDSLANSLTPGSSVQAVRKPLRDATPHTSGENDLEWQKRCRVSRPAFSRIHCFVVLISSSNDGLARPSLDWGLATHIPTSKRSPPTS